MRHARTMGLAILVVVASTAFAAASAQANAPRWTYTDGGVAKTLVGGQNKAFAAETTGHPLLLLPLVTLESTTGCTSTGEALGSGAGTPGQVTMTLHCTGVDVEELATCNVHSPGAAKGTVKTKPLTGTLIWLEGPESSKDKSVGITIQAEGGGSLVEIEVTECALAGKFPLEGNEICEFPAEGKAESPVTTHLINGTFTCPGPLTYYTNQTPIRTKDTDKGLTVKGAAAALIAHFVKVQVGGGLEWGIEPG